MQSAAVFSSCTTCRISLNMQLLLSCVKGGTSTSRTKPLILTTSFFIPETLFSPMHNTCQCLEQDVSPVCLSKGTLVSIIYTSVSIRLDRSQGSKPTSWVPPGNHWTYFCKEDDSITACCHVARQITAQWHDASQKADVSPRGESRTDRRTCEETAVNKWGWGNSWKWAFTFSNGEPRTAEVTLCVINVFLGNYDGVYFLCFTPFGLFDFPFIWWPLCKFELGTLSTFQVWALAWSWNRC